MRTHKLGVIVLLTFVFCLRVRLGYSYSVLTHEAIIDSTWKDSIVKVLRTKFPRVTEEQLKEAHAYAYGGCIIQDGGYYPFGSHLFSDLTHYVRSGDFVLAMLRDAQDLNDYAFALGALAHYTADNTGHPMAINRSVPLLYPKLQREYGDSVPYADNPKAHLRTEFGFDVVQVARGRYAPDAYRDFIGFEVSKPLLERAFAETYAIELKDVFTALDLSLGTYRQSVSTLIPKFTRAAWADKKDEILKIEPTMTQQRFLYNISRAEYEKTWGREYHRPGTGARTLAFLMKIMPKVGPFKAGAFRTPTPETEQLFMKSFNATVDRYRALLNDEAAGHPHLTNENFDLGEPSQAGRYKLADQAYASLVHRLAKRSFTNVPRPLRDNILAFYKGASTPLEPKHDSKQRRELYQELEQLRAFDGGSEPTTIGAQR
jgi:hypothetical protein